VAEEDAAIVSVSRNSKGEVEGGMGVKEAD